MEQISFSQGPVGICALVENPAAVKQTSALQVGFKSQHSAVEQRTPTQYAVGRFVLKEKPAEHVKVVVFAQVSCSAQHSAIAQAEPRHLPAGRGERREKPMVPVQTAAEQTGFDTQHSLGVQVGLALFEREKESDHATKRESALRKEKSKKTKMQKYQRAAGKNAASEMERE